MLPSIAADTAGCKSVTNFATPGSRISSNSYSQQYEENAMRNGETEAVSREGVVAKVDADE
jgi:hypothetical protein